MTAAHIMILDDMAHAADFACAHCGSRHWRKTHCACRRCGSIEGVRLTDHRWAVVDGVAHILKLPVSSPANPLCRPISLPAPGRIKLGQAPRPGRAICPECARAIGILAVIPDEPAERSSQGEMFG